MSEQNEGLRALLQSFFCDHHRMVSEESVNVLLRDVQAANVDLPDLIHLLVWLVDQRYHWAMGRLAGNGSGQVQSIEFQKHHLLVKCWTGDDYEFCFENGYRWRTQQGWVARNDVEDALGAWPGYIDALEDLYDCVIRECEALDEAKVQTNHEFNERWDRTYAQLEQRAALDRHPTLRMWRTKNPTKGTDVPLCLRSVRHVKRVEVVEPCYVYFLLKNDEVVYVGQTTAPWPARILQHLGDKGKEFDDIWYVEVDRRSISWAEKEYIKKFNPRYNRAGVKRDPSSSLSVVNPSEHPFDRIPAL